jgi:hypothetical protein
MICNLVVAALSFSAPGSVSRRDALGGLALAGLGVSSPAFAKVSVPAPELVKETVGKETDAQRLARLGLKPATAESIANNFNPNGVSINPARSASNPNPNAKIQVRPLASIQTCHFILCSYLSAQMRMPLMPWLKKPCLPSQLLASLDSDPMDADLCCAGKVWF